jgi:hypothetical protein
MLRTRATEGLRLGVVSNQATVVEPSVVLGHVIDHKVLCVAQ